MTKKNKRNKPAVVEVVMDSVKTYKLSEKNLTVVEGTVGNHTIHRTAGNERAVMARVQRAFNKR